MWPNLLCISRRVLFVMV